MNNLKKITGVNLMILVIYLGLFGVMVAQATGEDGLGPLILGMLFLGLQVGINFVVAVVKFFRREPDAPAYLISAIVVLVIGFSSCLGGLMTM
jgi:hypothetical protein